MSMDAELTDYHNTDLEEIIHDQYVGSVPAGAKRKK